MSMTAGSEKMDDIGTSKVHHSDSVTSSVSNIPLAATRRRESKHLTSNSWSSFGDGHPFHLLMCSEAGKPIYCYNKTLDESAIVSLAAVCQAITNFFADSSNGDTLKCINSLSGLKVTFALKPPLIMIVVTHRLSPVDPQLIINQSFSQMVSILTLKQLKTVFEFRPTFDLRSVLSRSDNKLVDILIEDCLLKNASIFSRKIKFCGQKSDQKSFSVNGYLTSVPLFLSSAPLQVSSGPTNSSSSSTINITNSTNRVMIPVLPLTPAMRESITSMIMTSINSVKSEVLFALLFQRKVRPQTASFGQQQFESPSKSKSSPSLKASTDYDHSSTQLVTIYNHNSRNAKLFPEDVQLIMSHVINSDAQLSSAESLWIPICLPHLDSSAFIHCHISYLTCPSNRTPSPVIVDSAPDLTASDVNQDVNQVLNCPEVSEEVSNLTSGEEEEKLCFLILSIEKDDFHKCQQIKDTLCERLNKVKLIGWPLSVDMIKNDVHQLQMFSYFSHKPFSIIYRSFPFLPFTNYHPLIALISHRMNMSNLKTLWMTSDMAQVTILASSSSAGMFIFQFDHLITHSDALIAASKINSWIKKEEDKIKIKDYL